MVTAFHFLVAALAAARLTHLITSDTITEPLRVRVVAYSGADGWLWKLVRCPFCIGFWISAATILVARYVHHEWVWLALTIFAVSQVVGMIETWVSQHGDV